MSKAWAKGSTPQWRRIRESILIRDNYTCRIKIAGVCTTRATCVHHTKGRLVTGDDPRYLVASCRECNAKIGDPNKKPPSPDPEPRPMTKW